MVNSCPSSFPIKGSHLEGLNVWRAEKQGIEKVWKRKTLESFFCIKLGDQILHVLEFIGTFLSRLNFEVRGASQFWDYSCFFEKLDPFENNKFINKNLWMACIYWCLCPSFHYSVLTVPILISPKKKNNK